MHLSASGFPEIPIEVKEEYAANAALLQLNLFEKRDLMTSLQSDPPRDKQININQQPLP